MKRLRIPLIVAVLIGGLVFVKIKFLGVQDQPAGGNAPQSGKAATAGKTTPTAQLSGIVLRTRPLDNKIYSVGTVVANRQIDLQVETAGKIVELNIREGRHVAKGTLLARVNDTELRAQLKKLEYQLQLNQQKEERARQLLPINGISKEDYDALVNQINTAKADIELLHAQLAKTRLRAPFAGIIGFRNADVGSYVSTATKIATLQQIDPLKLDFPVPEQYLPAIHNGNPVGFTVQGDTRQYSGTVYAIDPRVDLSTRSFTVRALCPNTGARILPGSFAKVQIDLERIGDAMMIPSQALIPVLKGYKVFICLNGKAAQVNVQTGMRTDAEVQITAGLAPGDTVITSGIMTLKPDMPVKVTIRE